MAAPQSTLGENVAYSVTGNKLTITIDLTHRGQESASGKSVRVATTGGNQKVPGTTVTIGINAYEKR
jgi:hypothetical protein